MLKNIPIPSPLSPVEGILIKRKTLERYFSIERLEQQAHQRAKRILREAEEEAKTLRMYAYQEGYEQGMIDALQQVAAYLTDNQTMAWKWMERIQIYARELFSAAVDHPETLLTVLDEWLRDFDKPEGQLFLTLPVNAKKDHQKLMVLLMENWPGTFNLKYHQEQRFIMSCGDQIAEFSPEQFVETAVGVIKHHLDELPQDCRTISDNAINALIDEWKTKTQAL
ncbi:type III secretion system linker protein OrgB [Salmonella enterica]|nr:type III secretion system linker protein OrgB [Salmonella enterica]